MRCGIYPKGRGWKKIELPVTAYVHSPLIGPEREANLGNSYQTSPNLRFNPLGRRTVGLEQTVESEIIKEEVFMKFKSLMIIKAIVCLGFGPLLLFLPAQLLNLLGTSYGPGAALTAREYGAALIGNLMLTWFARNAEKSTARKAIILHLFVYDAIALIATLFIQLSGGLNILGWGIVFVYLFFTVGFGYLLLQEGKTG